MVRWDAAEGTSYHEMNRISTLVSTELREIPGVQNVRAKSVVIGGTNQVFAPVYGPPFIRDVEGGRRYGTIDDLDKVILEGQGNREAAAVDANRILDDEIRRYLTIERSKQVAPVIAELRDRGEDFRNEVLEQARRRLAQGADGDEVLEYATAALMKKLLHTPSVRLRKAGEESEDDVISIARELFGIDEE